MPSDIGDSVPLAWDVKDAAGALTNAGTATLTITLPDGTTVSPSVTNPPASTGQYRVTYVPTIEGRYSWRAVSTSPNTAYQDVFEVREAASPSLLSLADAKAHLNITSTTHDDELREFLEAATEIIESHVGAIVRRTHTDKLLGGGETILLPHMQVLEVTALTLDRDGSSPLALSDLSIDGPAGILRLKSCALFPYGWLNITYKVGRAYVKPNWTLAAKDIVKYNWRSQLGGLPAIQGDQQDAPLPGFMIPPSVAALLAPDDVPVGFA